MTAHTLAGGSTALSYKGVTLRALTANMRNMASGQGLRVVITKGAVTSYDEGSSTPGKLVTQAVSVDLCADGKECQEIVIASLGASGKCWYVRQAVGNRSIARKEHLRIGYEYQVASVPVCKAGDAPQSGWKPGYPNPNL
jgi:hypothetical protein